MLKIVPDDFGRLLDALFGLRCQHQPPNVVAQQGELRHRNGRRRGAVIGVTTCGGGDDLMKILKFIRKYLHAHLQDKA